MYFLYINYNEGVFVFDKFMRDNKYKFLSEGVSCSNLGGLNVCLKKEDIVEPKNPTSMQELLNEAKKLSRMKLFKED